jgi:Tol biopolymer transport system component
VTRAALQCVVLVCTLSCVTSGVPESELPEDPIAISYRTPEEARRRAEDWDDSQAAGAPSDAGVPRPSRQGRADLVASEDDVDAILSRVFGGSGGEDDAHLGRLALLNPRTREVEVIGAARRGAIPLAWSPDRERLLFSQPDRQNLEVQVYEYARADATVRPVTQGPLSHAQACYAPEGRIVVAVVDTREKPYRSHIAMSGPGGRSPFETISEGPTDHSPVCRPGQEGIAFVRDDPPSAEIYYLERGALRRLSPGRHPAFSPDGDWLVFAAPVKRELRLWRIRPDGTGRAPVGRGIRPEVRPAVSPDGRLVAYVASEAQPGRHVYVRRFDGSGDRILFSAGDGEFPVW